MASEGKGYRTVDVQGYRVLIGRSSEDNDYLTLRIAKKRDLWLHVGGGTPGSHVVVQNPSGGDIPSEVITRAAELAAWYSKARGAPRVEVHVCRASDVSKAPGAPRGQVQIKRFSKLKVVPTAPAGASD